MTTSKETSTPPPSFSPLLEVSPWPFKPALSARAVWIVLTLISLAAILGNLRPMTPFRVTQWWFSYELGFIKRGLPGTLLLPFVHLVGHTAAVYLASMAIVLGTAIAMSTAATCFVVSTGTTRASWLLAIALLVMPGSLPSIAMDLGRYDGALVVCMFASLGLACRLKRGKSSGSGILLVAIQMIGVLIHEIYVFLAAPVLFFAAMTFRDSLGRQAKAYIASALAAGVFATLFVASKGRVSGFHADRLFASAYEQIGTEPDLSAILVLTRNLGDNLSLTSNYFTSWVGFSAIVSVAIAFSPVALLFSNMLSGVSRTYLLMLVCAGIAPMTLSFIGVDIGRWCAFATINVMTCSMLLIHGQHARGQTSCLDKPLHPLAMFAVVAGGAMGGMDRAYGLLGIHYLFEALQKLTGTAL